MQHARNLSGAPSCGNHYYSLVRQYVTRTHTLSRKHKHTPEHTPKHTHTHTHAHTHACVRPNTQACRFRQGSARRNSETNSWQRPYPRRSGLFAIIFVFWLVFCDLYTYIYTYVYNHICIHIYLWTYIYVYINIHIVSYDSCVVHYVLWLTCCDTRVCDTWSSVTHSYVWQDSFINDMPVNIHFVVLSISVWLSRSVHTSLFYLLMNIGDQECSRVNVCFE